jgi:AraC-like DNA-binding protein
VLGAPGELLRDYVLAYAGFPPGTPQPPVQRVLPSGIVPLMLEFSHAPGQLVAGRDRARLPGQPVFGLHERAVLVEPQPAHGITVVLTPPGAHALFGIALRDLAGTITGAADLLGSRAQLLAGQLAETPGWPARFALLDQALAAWLARGPAPAPAVIRAWRRLHDSGGQLRITRLAAEVGTSRRYLEKQFGVQVGLTPKAVARIIRFQAAARLIVTAPDRDLARLACAAGYSDHAHLDREFRDMSGCTPTQFLAERAARPAASPAPGKGTRREPGAGGLTG